MPEPQPRWPASVHHTAAVTKSLVESYFLHSCIQCNDSSVEQGLPSAGGYITSKLSCQESSPALSLLFTSSRSILHREEGIFVNHVPVKSGQAGLSWHL